MGLPHISKRPGLMTMLIVVLMSVVQVAPTHAQLSCDDPPFDVSRIQVVWNLTDFCTFQDGVLNQIISGGVPRDGIPPIDDPQFEDIAAGWDWLAAQSPVIAIQVDGIARAYPLAILTRHEIVNDEIGDTPIAITFCPLCNSALVFDSRVDGVKHRFGVSGLLRNSDLIMWDDQTQSWWQQLTGEGIVGVYTGRQLTILPSQVVGFGAFADQYPEGEVLSRSGGGYGSNGYVGYDSNANPFLFLGEPDTRLFPTSRVLAGLVGGEAIAYPFDVLAAELVINDGDVVAFWQPGATSALDQRAIDESRDVGMAALYSRELDDRKLTFSYDEVNNQIVDDETSSVWNVFGTAMTGPLAGNQLRQLNAAPHFWFAWAAFQPDTVIWGAEVE